MQWSEWQPPNVLLPIPGLVELACCAKSFSEAKIQQMSSKEHPQGPHCGVKTHRQSSRTGDSGDRTTGDAQIWGGCPSRGEQMQRRRSSTVVPRGQMGLGEDTADQVGITSRPVSSPDHSHCEGEDLNCGLRYQISKANLQPDVMPLTTGNQDPPERGCRAPGGQYKTLQKGHRAWCGCRDHESQESWTHFSQS